ncbi:MAG: hypothetical protein M3O91_04390 [Chloroflexota bacterium]|nr:hypothetical protein [Chloroflexota bacterium]
MRALGPFLLALVLASSCSPPAPRAAPTEDVPEAPRLAREAGAILLQLSAYDYALAGALAHEKERTVPPDRYAVIARAAGKAIADEAASAVSATASAKGTLRDRVVGLADALTDLARDAGAYADGADPASFARAVDDVRTCWARLRALADGLPADAALQRTIERGTSFRVFSEPSVAFALTVGPFGSAADAGDAARRIGQTESVSTAPPFVVRVGTFSDRISADAAAGALAGKGFSVSLVTEEPRYAFSRGGPAPDAELWREPAQAIDSSAGTRRVALSPDAAWVATGADDGTVAIFAAAGALRALPKFAAGVSQVLFADDGNTVLVGGQTLAVLAVPSGATLGATARLTAAAGSGVFVNGARAFAAAAPGPETGGAGTIAGRAPDGTPLALPFPLVAPPSGAVLAASGSGELLIVTAGGSGTDVEALKVGQDRYPRGILHTAGRFAAVAVDRTGTAAAFVTDQGTFRFGPHETDPAKSLVRVGGPARAIAFGPAGALYLLEASRVSAVDPAGATLWSAPLIDGRRMTMASRLLILDGPDRLVAFTLDGATSDDLGTTGQIQDVSVSGDGKRVAVAVDQRRVLLFTLQ